VLHEGCAGILGVRDYLAFLAGAAAPDELDRAGVERAFGRIAGLERPLLERLLGYLTARGDVRLIGPAATDGSRVATVSFVRPGRSSKEIVLAVNDRGIGIRYGHFYAHRLATALGLDPDDGVVRTSALHYNTPGEIERLLGCFDELL
jgi:selenocysteine lyase/cysteine desulfurase